MAKDKFIGKVLQVLLPKNKRPRYRWITRKKGERYYARAPKIGVLIRNLKLTRNSDFGTERLLPTKAIIIPKGQVFGMKS